MMRRAMLLAGLLACACLAAPPPPALAGLADRARSLPSEFAADSLLRIADAPQAGAAWKRALIEEAFHLAAASQQPYARHAWSESRAGQWGRAFGQGLDACTLQCRAVHAMLALDPKNARALFAEIPSPKIPRLSCEDPLIYDDSIFYTTLGEIAQRTFSPKEIADEEPLHLLQHFASGMTSPVEAGPVARMLAGASLPPAQLTAAVASFIAALSSLPDDDRSFTAGAPGQVQVAALAEACTHAGVSPMPLLEAWRAYIVRHLTAARCADVSRQSATGMSIGLAQASGRQSYSGPVDTAQFFNDKLRTGDLQPIAGNELQPAKLEGEAQPIAPCESAECRQISTQFAALLLGPVGLAYSEEQKAGGEWGAKLKLYLSALADWKCADNPAECFHWKSHFYGELWTVVPAGPNRDALITALLSWLQLNGYQRDHRAEWFYPVNVLLVRAFADPPGMHALIAELLKSPDPIISLYAQLEQTLPRPLDRTLPLL